ncbi:MAG TPA: DUF3014 domain-containing protein [Burkholderiales bacterium]|nr:DUF3014 domain-containing protein [Burkholderiales bacterium]
MHEDDRPYIRPVRRFNPWLAVAAIGVVAWLGAFSFRHWLEPASLPQPPLQVGERPAAPPPADEPAIRHPLEAPAAAALPALDNSDSMMRESLAGLIGGQAFAGLVVPAQLVRRIVATVDNLPRRTAPTRVMPLNAVPGAFSADGYARYTPYVRVLEALDAPALVQGYARAYPLFQRAYEELGFPGRYFNDRLIAAIDDLLATPELDAAPELVRPRVLYEFADPDLETRSAGQKILLRMGRDNAARVKAKLWEIRRELLAASGRR